MANYLGFDLGLSLTSPYDDDGFVGVQINALGIAGLDGKIDVGVTAYEVHAPGGLLHRPLDPVIDTVSGEADPSGACQVLFALEGGQGHAWVMEDPRILINLPKLAKGETLLYGSRGQFVRMSDDGSVDIVTRSSVDQTKTPDKDTAVSPDVTFNVGPNGLLFDFPGVARFTIDRSGAVLNHKDGGRLGLEYIAGIPGLGQLTSSASLTAGQISLESALLALGPNDGQSDGAAKFTPLALVLGQIVATQQAIIAGLAGMVSAGGPAAAAPAAALMATLQASMTLNVAGPNPLMKSKTSAS